MSMRRLLILAFLAAVPLAWAGEPAAPQTVSDDDLDLVFFHSSRPYRLRLHLQIQGKSYTAHWVEVMKSLFRFLDQNGDGVLSAAELEHAPSVTQLKQMIQGVTDLEADEPPKIADLTDNPKAGVTLAQLQGYYHRVGVAPWQVDWVAQTSDTVSMDDAILNKLGAKDERLTKEEMKKAAEVLFKLDTDGDEILTLFEISPNGYSGNFNFRGNLQTKGVPFFLLDRADRGRELLAAAIVERYDRNKDGKLTANELSLPKELQQGLGVKPGEALTAKHLARWPDLPVDLELVVRLDGAGSEGIVILPSKDGAPGALAKAAAITRTGMVNVKLPREQIEFVRLDTTPQRIQRIQQTNMQLFDSLAKNGGDVLESRDIFQPPFALVAVFRLADRNGDNKLTRSEYQQFLELQQKLVTRSTVLTLVDRGRSLFDFLDADHDHRLSRRELMTMWDRLAPWADPKTGALECKNIPQQCQIIVSHGKPPQMDSDPGAAGALRPETRLRGPLWFRKMDRNADGDVSRAEFLGTDEQFKKLDRNGDGLIDLEEAEAAEREKKKSRPR